MSEAALQSAPSDAPAATQEALAHAPCEECVGTGGWFRYEPALEPSGLLYLSCVSCRGSGRTAQARA